MNFSIISLSSMSTSTTSIFISWFIINDLNLCGSFHLLFVCFSHLEFLLHLCSLFILQLPLHLLLLNPELFPLKLLLLPLFSILLVNCLGSCNMILGLTQQILALSSFNCSSSKI